MSEMADIAIHAGIDFILHAGNIEPKDSKVAA